MVDDAADEHRNPRAAATPTGSNSRARNWLAVAIVFLAFLLWVGRQPYYMPEGNMSTMQSGELSEGQKARLQTVADLMLDIYKTLVKMRYLDEASIQTGPHDIEKVRSMYEELGLDPSIVYLYSILPYIDTSLADQTDFLHGGAFADFRNPDDVEQGRDPFYGSPEGDDFDSEEGPYIRPWVSPLSLLGNHQSAIIYDARQHRIWIIDQEGWSSTDLALDGAGGFESASRNRNNFDHIPSRPAEDVLRDINSWFRTLKELPGGEHSGGEWSHWDLDLKGIYQKNGWPDHFDGDAFEVDQARAYAAWRAKDDAEQPLREVETYKSWSKYSDQDIERYSQAVARAKTEDDQWMARFDLWKTQRRQQRNERDLAKAEREAEKRCPGGVCQKSEDLPLWEFEMLRHENREKQERISHTEGWAKQSKDEPERERYFRQEQKRAEKEAAVYQKAYDAAKADAERLCPGRTFESATGLKSLGRQHPAERIQNWKESIASLQEELDKTRDWASQIPETAVSARKKLDLALQEIERTLTGLKKSLKREEDWLAEHGDTI